VRLGVNVPNFGPGTNPDVLRRWALTVEGLGFDLLMVSDHIAVTLDVAEPFYGDHRETTQPERGVADAGDRSRTCRITGHRYRTELR
jgi:hypothetical protein